MLTVRWLPSGVQDRAPGGDASAVLYFPRPEPSLTFKSKSEYAAAVLLEKYVPGFEVEMGKTFQVPIGCSKTCDFLIHGIFVEYHPINLHHEFDDKQASRRLSDALKRVPRHAKEEITSAIMAEFSERYYLRRKSLIDHHYGRNCELLVAHNPKDILQKIIRRLTETPPREKVFLDEFRALVRDR